jgi:hypothetical protein
MGKTEDQKMMLAAAYVRKCTDAALLLYVINEAHDRLNDLLEAEDENIQE